jgi:cbb3-type cytochrome oxidase subunit 3
MELKEIFQRTGFTTGTLWFIILFIVGLMVMLSLALTAVGIVLAIL